MTVDRAKISERISKLLALAAPSSGTTEAERSSAALEAARLIAEHEISFRAAEPPRPAPRRETMRGVWLLSIALQPCSCSKCWKTISKADVIWTKVLSPGEIEHRHNFGLCVPG